MDVKIFFDGNEDSGALEAFYQFLEPLEKYFEKKKYGVRFPSIYIVYVCLNPEVNFKKRLRYGKKDHLLSFDIILEPSELKLMTQDERVRLIIKKTISELVIALEKYEKKLGFEKEELVADFIAFCKNKKWC
jgi:hypothetical protein